MNRYVIGSLWDRDNRNGANKNFEYLFEGSNRVTELNKRADSILSESNATLNEAKQTNDMNKDVQQQIDILIAESGTSDAEVLQARVSSTGNKFTTLKERLDNNEEKTAIYLTDYGVSHLKSATENTASIKQAITDAEEDSRPIIFPWMPAGKFIDINEPLQILNGNIEVTGFGRQSRIRQTVFPNAIFDVLAPNVHIHNLSFFGVDFNATGYASRFRGNSTAHTYYCGIYASGNNITIKDIYGENLSTLIQITNWDNATEELGELSKNIEVYNVESKNVVFNLLVGGVDGMKFSGIKGHYKLMTGVTTPPHLVYFTDTNTENKNVQGENCLAQDGEYSYAYQFKGVSHAEFNGLLSDNSRGFIHFMDCKNVNYSNCSSVRDTFDNQAYASLYLEASNENVIGHNIFIEMTGDGKPVRMSAESTECSIKGIEVISNHTLESSTVNLYDIDINGTGNTVSDIKVRNIGSHPRTASVGIWGGTNNKISNIKSTQGNDHVFEIRGGSHHTVEHYDLDKLQYITKTISIGTGVVNFKLKPFYVDYTTSENDRLLVYDRCNIYTGNFFNANKTTSGHTWIWSFGTFKHDGNGGLFVFTAAGALIGLDLERPNIDLRTDLKYGDREEVVVRAIDNKTHLGFRINHNTNTAQLIKRVVGEAESTLTSAPYTTRPGKIYRLRVTAFDDIIECYVDGAKILEHVLSTTDMATFDGNTFHGLKGDADDGGVFSNIEYREIE